MARKLTVNQRLALISKWKSPPSSTEQLRLERAERMVRAAVAAYGPFRGLEMKVDAKGSYPNSTNVRGDSDVDTKIQVNNPYYVNGSPSWDPPVGRGEPPLAVWPPDQLREHAHAALADFFGRVDADHNVAFYVPEVAGSRPSIDVVPCFKYQQFRDCRWIEGSIVHARDGQQIINWPELQLANGCAKNIRTGHRYKIAVRVLKNVENNLADEGVIAALPSYFSECLIYNVPDDVLKAGSLDAAVRNSLNYLSTALDSFIKALLMVEPNDVKKLFEPGQKWNEKDALDLIEGAWRYLGYGD
ncbi:Cyclic dipyrimidine nucleotide synthase [Streptomyces alboniger]